MISKPLLTSFKTLVISYGEATGSSTVKVSKILYGNANFLDRLFSGEQSVSLTKLDEMLDKLVEIWPPDARWPILPVVVLRGPRRGELSPSRRRAG